MPAVSQAQRGYLFATKGAAWARLHHFDNKGKLPAHAPGTTKENLSRVRKRAAKKALGRS